MRAPFRILLALALVSGCGDLQLAGVDEPFRVEGGAFHSGEHPEASSDGSGPRVTTTALSLGVIPPGGQGVSIDGNVTGDAYAVGLFVVGHGSGFWVIPVQGFDPAAPTERTFQARIGFGDLPAGSQRLRVIALDEDGNPGGYQDRTFCVQNPVFDSGNACNSAVVPPATVVSLHFNSVADVDLILAGSDGTTVDGRSPVGGSGDRTDPTAPRLERESNTRCVPDGLNRENIYFRENPPEGRWDVYVNLFNSCGVKSTSFAVEVHQRVDHGDGTYGLELTERYVGVLRAEDAGSATGGRLYVTSLDFH